MYKKMEDYLWVFNKLYRDKKSEIVKTDLN